MKKLIILFFSAALFASCNDSIRPSGNVISMERETGEFTALEVHSGITAVVTMSNKPGLTVIADDNLAAEIETYKSGETLIVKVRNNLSIKGSDATLKVAVHAVSLTRVSASGGSSVKFSQGIYTNELSVELNGGSQLRGEIRSGQLDVELSGGSNICTTGSAACMTLECSGGSDFNWGDCRFEADALKAEISGGSKAAMTVGTSLDVRASGGSKFYYKGNPDPCKTDGNGSSTIKHLE